MGIFEKVGLGMAGAAALGACSPEKAPDQPLKMETVASDIETVASNTDAIVTPKEAELLEKSIPAPEATGPEQEAAAAAKESPQWTEEQKAEILSGTTQEVD
jgi:hypothetical protein